MFAKLGPPGDPVEPEVFDFRRLAYFEGLGAVGYARGAALRIEAVPPSGLLGGLALWLAGQRFRLADALVVAMPGRQGASRLPHNSLSNWK